MKVNNIRTNILNITHQIVPYDAKERLDIRGAVSWIQSGAELFRRVKPDIPDRHLVSYFVLVDSRRQSLLLLHHRRSGLWLPSGGHVEPDEDPRNTVIRELTEELGPRAALVSEVADLPLFLTVTGVRDGDKQHTDISLWYIVAADAQMWLDPDPREFTTHRWQTFTEVLDTDPAELDPQMHRFVTKLQTTL